MRQKEKRALLLCGHGSRDAGAVEEFGVLAATMKGHALEKNFLYECFAHGFLEFARPTLGEALDALRAQGVGRVDALPGMLLAAGHAKNDIPALLRAYEHKHGVAIRYGRPLGGDARMLSAAGSRGDGGGGGGQP